MVCKHNPTSISLPFSFPLPQCRHVHQWSSEEIATVAGYSEDQITPPTTSTLLLHTDQPVLSQHSEPDFRLTGYQSPNHSTWDQVHPEVQAWYFSQTSAVPEAPSVLNLTCMLIEGRMHDIQTNLHDLQPTPFRHNLSPKLGIAHRQLIKSHHLIIRKSYKGSQVVILHKNVTSHVLLLIRQIPTPMSPSNMTTLHH